MKKLLICLFSIILFASGCHKESNMGILTPDGRIFFQSQNRMFVELQKAIQHFDKSEILQKISNAEFYDKGENSIALIYFKSSKGEGSIAIEKKFNSNTKKLVVDPVKEISCSGRCAGNRCQVRSVMKNGVLDYVECTCGDCEMHIITDPHN